MIRRKVRDPDAATLGEVVVTGTRIRRDTIDTPAPIVALGPEELEDRGAQDLNETVAELPFVSQSNSPTSDAGHAQSNSARRPPGTRWDRTVSSRWSPSH